MLKRIFGKPPSRENTPLLPEPPDEITTHLSRPFTSPNITEKNRVYQQAQNAFQTLLTALDIRSLQDLQNKLLQTAGNVLKLGSDYELIAYPTPSIFHPWKRSIAKKGPCFLISPANHAEILINHRMEGNNILFIGPADRNSDDMTVNVYKHLAYPETAISMQSPAQNNDLKNTRRVHALLKDIQRSINESQ